MEMTEQDGIGGKRGSNEWTEQQKTRSIGKRKKQKRKAGNGINQSTVD
jgi:hypothetical protein